MKTPHQLTENVKLLQKVVLWQGEKFLILQKSADAQSRPNYWDLPGGNVEWPKSTVDVHDSHLVDLVREVKEETGLIIDGIDSNDRQGNIGRQNLKSCFVGSYFESKRQIYTIIIGWQYRLPESIELPNVELSSEHQNYAWIKSTDFDQYDFGFAGEEGGFIREMVRNSVELIEKK